ncbi:hypothetical protein ZOSMA_767G00020 [Zostera marina]|uniref:Pentatricopeptide repeat-containing protein n=1 Tax=Zostera marina TaxID=29655 RepID=A0A0K9NP81_ZOSMR|nr:hypothetical protein ZOSMA_767G00020 [Zostera marina]
MVSGVSSNTLKALNSKIQSASPEASILLYNLLRRQSIFPDTYTIPSVLGRVGFLRSLPTVKSIHGEILKYGFDFNVYVQNSLIHAYFLCGSQSEGRKVFDHMKTTTTTAMDAVTWNTVMSGYLSTNDQAEKSLEIFSDMIKERCFLLDRVCVVKSLIGCGRTGRIKLGKQIHGRTITSGLADGRDFYLGSSSIQMYVNCGYMTDARNVFDALSDMKNLICWTSMIAGYTNSDMFLAALDLFRKMQMEGGNKKMKADAVTVACVLSSCAHLGALVHGKWLHAYCSTHGLIGNLKVKTALIIMYSKCGDIQKALDIFTSTSPDHRDVYIWTSMICGLAIHGRAEESVCFFETMKNYGRPNPNEVTFLGVLTACVHGGLVALGLQFFSSMLTTYNLKPKIQHYGCVIDLLCRAKLLEQAEEFIAGMTVEPDSVIWRSVMFGWVQVGNLERAETIGRKLTEREPAGTIGAQVLLSNVYALSSKWRDVKRVRSKLKHRQLQKVPGCSFVEIDGVVHEFLAGDCDIPPTLKRMVLNLKDQIVSWTSQDS